MGVRIYNEADTRTMLPPYQIQLSVNPQHTHDAPLTSLTATGHSKVPLDSILLSHTYSVLNSCWLLQFVSISWPIGLYGDMERN